MKPKTWAHPKFALLQRKLSVCPALAAGILEGIWHLAATFDPEAGTLDHTAEELTAWMGVDLDPDELLAALVALGWIDRDGDALSVHNWEEHRPAYLDKQIRDREYQRRRRTTSDDCRTTSPDTRTTSDDIARSRAPSDSDSDSDSDSVLNGSTNVLSQVEEIAEEWNGFVSRIADQRFGKLRKLTVERKRKVTTRIKADPEWAATFTESLSKLPIPNTDTFTWQPDFNWLIENGDHVYRLVEGKYHTGKPTQRPTPQNAGPSGLLPRF